MGLPQPDQGEKQASIHNNSRSLSIPTNDQYCSQDDIAATILPSHAQPIDPVLEHRVRRKIDLFFIPLMWIGYGLVYYDKVCQTRSNPSSISISHLTPTHVSSSPSLNNR